MPNVSSNPRVRVSRARDARGAIRVTLFKVDHPRAIDRHIDYFGAPAAARRTPVCGESLFESVLERDRAA